MAFVEAPDSTGGWRAKLPNREFFINFELFQWSGPIPEPEGGTR